MVALLLSILLLFGGAQRATAAPAEGDLFAEAESRYLGRNYTAALEAYDSFLKSYPLSERVSDVQYRKAASLYHLGRYADSLALLQDIEQHYRSTRYLQFVPLWQGLAQYQLGNYSLSTQSLNLFLAGPSDPDFTPQALLYRALDEVNLTNEAQAIADLQSLITTYPNSAAYPYSVVLLGSLLQKAGSYDKLLALTEGIESASIPQRWRDDFLLLKAEALSGTGRDSEALAVYRGLTSAQDDIAVAAYGWLFTLAERSQDLQQMQDLTSAAETRFSGRTALLSGLWTRVGAESFDRGAYDTAESFLRRAWNVRKSAPVSEVVPLYLAEILLARKDAAGARALLEEYVAGGSVGTGAAIIRLGDIALLTDDFATAARWYAQFRQMLPQSSRAPEAGYMLAYGYYRQGNAAGSLRLVDELERLPLDAGLAQQVARLKIVLLKAAGRMSEAADALALYVGRYPSDLGSRIDYLKVLFVLKRTDELLVEADAVRRQFPSLEKDNPSAALLVSYLRGLALIAAKSYGAAVTELAAISPAAADKAGLTVIVPYAGYYLGWGYLRGGDYARAADVFDRLAASYPSHELTPMALYLAGWSHFSAGDYTKAASAFSTLASKPGQGDLSSKAQYLYAKSLMNLQRRDEAATTLRKLAFAAPPTPWSADALFDYASVLSDLGQVSQSADAYLQLTKSYPNSPLSEEALYRRGETFATHQQWKDAQAAFDEYRTRYPKGKLLDAALYWGGQAAYAMGQGMGAALLWEQLIAGYRDSPFRGAALQKTAEAYADAHDYAKALDLYNRYISGYPDDARSSRADIRAEQLRYLAQGADTQEATLSAAVASSTGPAKLRATVDLARFYIYSGDTRADAGYRLVLPIAKADDPAIAATAQALVGEYFYRKGDLDQAAQQFLAVALVPKVDPASSAAAIYRAAEMMQLAKKPVEVSALVKRLEQSFPSSDWTTKARLLQGTSP